MVIGLRKIPEVARSPMEISTMAQPQARTMAGVRQPDLVCAIVAITASLPDRALNDSSLDLSFDGIRTKG
jgi:hypothetical protein